MGYCPALQCFRKALCLMDMEKKKAKSRPSAEKDKKKKTPDPPPDDGRQERPFDMGGLPTRDLKKNLGGCG